LETTVGATAGGENERNPLLRVVKGKKCPEIQQGRQSSTGGRDPEQAFRAVNIGEIAGII